jgi:hypothetical protein
MTDDPTADAVDRLLEAQFGLATRGQLLDAGLTRSALAWRLTHGWRLVLPRVVSAGTLRLDPRQQMAAALLFSGDDTVVTSLAASTWHGVTAASGRPLVHVLVPARRRVNSTGFVVVRRTTRIEDQIWQRGPLRLASRARAVADAARDSNGPDDARALVIEAVQRRLVRVEDLRNELEAGPRRRSHRLRVAVQDAEAGAWSVPEVDLATLVRGSRLLPPMWLNPDLTASDGTTLPRPDGWFDDVALALLVHSRRHHADGDEWDHTVHSDGVFPEYGVIAVPVTPRRIRSDPAGVLRRIERAYAAARQRPRPDVVAVPLGHGLVS